MTAYLMYLCWLAYITPECGGCHSQYEIDHWYVSESDSIMQDTQEQGFRQDADCDTDFYRCHFGDEEVPDEQ